MTTAFVSPAPLTPTTRAPSAGPSPADLSVPDLFRVRARRAPGAVAVSTGTEQVSYAELDAWSGVLADVLGQDFGVAHRDRVAVCIGRSPELVTALLGVLTAGAVYVPIDPSEPVRRVHDKLADAGVRLALVDDAGRRLVEGSGVPTAEVPGRPGSVGITRADPPRAATPADLAYLMYTSGSTGTPKAVMVEHRNIVNLVTEPNFIDLRPCDTILQLAPVAFDAATFEIWGALLNGAELAVAPPGPVEPEDLGQLLADRGVSVLWLTAALLHRQIDVDPAAFVGLHSVLAGGDVLSAPHLRRLRSAAPDCEVVNGYGPTETTTFALCHRVDVKALGSTVPIGRPLQNVSVLIVDETGTPVPDGTPGELWIEGAGVSRGYWGRPDLTARSFAPETEPRRYSSGDRGVRRTDGLIEFLGRRDGQFKLRGFRIEPAEVEAALAEHPQVGAAAVGVRENHRGEHALVAWVDLAVGVAEIDRRDLRAHLRSRLPAYLIPTGYVMLDRLPVTTNGKVDRRALLDPDWLARSTYV